MSESLQKPKKKSPASQEREARRLAEQDTKTQTKHEQRAKKRAETLEKVDDLLDEIDEILEAEAEDFVKLYIQKGGE